MSVYHQWFCPTCSEWCWLEDLDQEAGECVHCGSSVEAGGWTA